MEKCGIENTIAKPNLLRCVDWLQRQNKDESSKLQNKNDIQFIIETNAARKNFLLAAAEDEATVPAGIDDPSIEPKLVSLHKLRVEDLNMECEWQACRQFFTDYKLYQDHVRNHSSDAHVIEAKTGITYVCLWDICGYKTPNYREIVRHLNYHAYHGKLLAIGFNGRATLKLLRCKKDSAARNQIPVQSSDYSCMWVGCNMVYNSIQKFFDHVKGHTSYVDPFCCSWAGCGATFPRREMLVVHVRSHTGERLIACYHCGKHFANNRKLCDHSRRQNIYSTTPYECSLCGTRCGSAQLLNDHERQHVSTWACTLCDMSAPSPAALAQHVRYRHISGKESRPHACLYCTHKAVTKYDLQHHMKTHKKRKKPSKTIKESISSDRDYSDEENSESEPRSKKVKSLRKYICHMCPEKTPKVFSRGTRLTTHLVQVHGAQWSFGHSRFRYQLNEDGFYRLTTTRYESLEVSRKIVDSYTGPKQLTGNFDFKLKQVAEPTEKTPRQFEVLLAKNPKEEMQSDAEELEEFAEDRKVEITMCDVDDKGNIISTETIKSIVFKEEAEFQ